MGENVEEAKLINRYGYYNKYQEFLTFIKVDENCNLNCTFCYQEHKENNKIDNEEKLKKCLFNLDIGINKFLNIIKNENFEYSKLNICFFGGEPTLNPWAINKICDYIIEHYPLSDRNKFNITYTSNGIIFNESIKSILKKMKSVNDNYLGIMISSDNEKEIYDKNRKIVGSNKSGYEIVQSNIKEYEKFLENINGKKGEWVQVATVLATKEQLENNALIIQQNFKNITRRGKILYDTNRQSVDYIEASKIFLNRAYENLIEHCTKKDKRKSLDQIIEGVFQLGDNDIAFGECQALYTIDGNGDINWCNKVKNFENEILSQAKMREYIFNKNIDNSHFNCFKDKFDSGKLVKDIIRPKLWEQMITKFDPNVSIIKLNINKNLNEEIALYNFIKYMIGSTEAEEREVYISNPSGKIINLCKEFDIKLSEQPIKSDVENTFYVDQEGNLFFDEIFKDDKEMILTNLKEKHFMWIHTPTLLNSVNKYFLEKLSC